ncbi:MAG TPA: CRISPR-associated protein Cas4 [Methylomirabilota bacterium]|jgi:CRISPR-associated exonuclease Cas4|nr:CRISPR-associated protein Cas4 [Methylomirabilota bacterium]
MIDLRVNDLKQFSYCQRIVFYQYVMPVEKKATFKMEEGKKAEAIIDKLEQRRSLRKYRLTEGTRRFHVWLRSSRLGLSGKLDLLIESPAGLFPIDFKNTTGRPQLNHLYQLCGYALLVEETYQQPVAHGCIYLIPQEEIVVMDLTDERKEETLAMLEAMRTMIRKEQMPEPTPVRNRCVECEYRNYCGDIF